MNCSVIFSLWDIGKSGNNIGQMTSPQNVEGSPFASFDSTGLVYGISVAMAGGEGNVSEGRAVRWIRWIEPSSL